MQPINQLQEQLEEYLAVSRAWRGLGGPMSIGQGIRRLSPIVNQSKSSLLSDKARKLMHEIISGPSQRSREAM